jgi:hypothetical protein
VPESGILVLKRGWLGTKLSVFGDVWDEGFLFLDGKLCLVALALHWFVLERVLLAQSHVRVGSWSCVCEKLVCKVRKKGCMGAFVLSLAGLAVVMR